MKNKRKQPPLVLSPESSISGRIQTDPQGSYTGRPEEILEEPVQDVDDL